MMKYWIGIASVIAGMNVMALCSVTANADTLFSNFSPVDGNDIDTGIHEAIGGSGFGATKRVAVPFTVATDSFLTSVDVALQQNIDPSITATINVGSFATPDDSQVVAAANVSVSGSFPHIVNIDFGSGTALSATNTYWLVLSPVRSFSNVSWFAAANTTAVGYAVSQSTDNVWLGFSGTTPSLRVNGTATTTTPEPNAGSFALIAVGAGFTLYRKRKQIQLPRY